MNFHFSTGAIAKQSCRLFIGAEEFNKLKKLIDYIMIIDNI